MATKPGQRVTKKSPKRTEPSRISSRDDIAAALFDKLLSPSTPEAHTEEPVSGLDKEVAGIFKQASEHRDKLVTFFIAYTWVFSGFVALIIIGQALTRALLPGKESIELVPYWALNLLVVGLIGQFITLLAIVTRKVWLFEEFFKHADGYHHKSTDPTIIQDVKEQEDSKT